jgi:hypothetical protein
VEEYTAVSTVAFSFNPENSSTLFPFNTPSTTCPPVTFVIVEFVSSVGMNWLVAVNMDAGNVPFRTWYSSILWTVAEFIAAAFPASVLRKLLKAALLGARTVMPVALARVSRRAGWEARRPVDCQELDGEMERKHTIECAEGLVLGGECL